MIRYSATAFAVAFLTQACGRAPGKVGTTSAHEDVSGDGSTDVAFVTWDAAMAMRYQADQLLKQKKYQAAFDKADTAFSAFQTFVTYSSTDGGDIATTKLALVQQLHLLDVQISAAVNGELDVDVDNLRQLKTQLQQNLQSLADGTSSTTDLASNTSDSGSDTTTSDVAPRDDALLASSTDDGNLPATGDLGQPCYSDLTCNDEISCAGYPDGTFVCIDPNAT